MKKISIIHITAAALAVLFSSCTTLVEKAGQSLDGTAAASKKIMVYKYHEKSKDGMAVKYVRNKAGDTYLTISVNSMPNILFKGSIPEPDGSFYITSYTFLCSSSIGWNEFTMEVSGTGTFENREEYGILRIHSLIEPLGISSGKIRYNAERLIGESALGALNNRHERILALVEWMQTQSNVPDFENEKAFKNYWKPLIFPELVSSKKRPGTWTRNNAEWSRADDINWNISYTEKTFPEELHIYRNSGGLLRDWEEAIGWIFLEYEWDHLCDQLNTTVQLTKK